MAKPLKKQMIDIEYKFRKNASISKDSRDDLKSEIGHAQREYTWATNSSKQVKRVIKFFDKYIKEVHPELKKAMIDEVPRKVMGDFLKYRESKGKSPSTISADMYGLNKVFGANLTKKEFGLSSRNADEFTNNRENEDSKKYGDLTDKAKRQLDVARAFGLRRNEYKHFNSKALFEDSNGRLHVYIGPSSKGGKIRTAACLGRMEEIMRERYGSHIRSISNVTELPLNKADWREITSGGKTLEKKTFDHDLPTHRLGRQYYAQSLLDELENENVKFSEEYLLEQNRTKTDISTLTTNGIRMDRRHAQYISLQLGHNRVDTLKSYIL